MADWSFAVKITCKNCKETLIDNLTGPLSKTVSKADTIIVKVDICCRECKKWNRITVDNWLKQELIEDPGYA